MLQIFTTVSLIVLGQNVGIGTTAPSEKLQVAGNIKTDTIKLNAIKLANNAGAGKVLTSDAAGNGIWETSNATTAGNKGFGVWGDCATNGNISEYFPVADAKGAAGDFFGYEVSISGNYAIVGVRQDDVDAKINQGSVNIYQYDGSGWVLMQKLTDPLGEAGDNFGGSVSISGNYAIVGAFLDDVSANSNQGSASIYQFDGTTWVLMQQLTDASGEVDDLYGFSVSISNNYAVVGAYQDDVNGITDQGSVSIYQFNGTTWELMQKMSGTPGAYFSFGISVSTSGNYVIVGAQGETVNANPNQGTASIYEHDGKNWILIQKIIDVTGALGDLFGRSVSISDNYAIIGANGDDVGANVNQGSASIYQYDGLSWVLMKKLTDLAGESYDSFGWNVSISGNYAIMGAWNDKVGTNITQGGSSSIYVRVGIGWQKLQYIIDPGVNESDQFGFSNSIDGTTKRFLIGATGYANGSGKVVFGKVN